MISRRITPVIIQSLSIDKHLLDWDHFPWMCTNGALARQMRFTYSKIDDDQILVINLSNMSPHVIIKPSNIHGLGVFAATNFRKNQVIGLYNGKVIGWKGGKEEKESSSKFLINIRVTKDLFIAVVGIQPTQDADSQRRALNLDPFTIKSNQSALPFGKEYWPGFYAHIMNDLKDDNLNNCVVQEDGAVVAKNDIGEGTELTWS